ATTMRSRLPREQSQRPMIVSDSPPELPGAHAEYESAVSMKFPPAAAYASRTAKAVFSSAVQPKTLPPRQSGKTWRSVRPRVGTVGTISRPAPPTGAPPLPASLVPDRSRVIGARGRRLSGRPVPSSRAAAAARVRRLDRSDAGAHPARRGGIERQRHAGDPGRARRRERQVGRSAGSDAERHPFRRHGAGGDHAAPPAGGRAELVASGGVRRRS